MLRKPSFHNRTRNAHSRFDIALPVVLCWAAYGASPPNPIRPVVLPVTEASDIRFIHVSFGSSRKEPSYSRIHDIVQGSKGFLWFGTQDKLDRYDGYEIREYPQDPKSPNAVFTRSLSIDKSNTLWGGAERWLDRFDPVTETYRRYPSSGAFDGAMSAMQDREGILWFATNYGLVRMDPATGNISRYKHRSNDPRSLSTNWVRASFETKDGTFWVATTDGLDLFDRQAGEVRRHISLPIDFPMRDPNPVLTIAFCEDHSGVLWITYSYGYGLARLNREAGTLTFYSLDGSGKDNSLQSGARSIVEDKDGALWIGTTSSGLLKLDRTRARFVRYHNNPADPESLSGDQVHALFLDREGNMWAGTNGAGLNRFAPRPLPFKVYQRKLEDPSSLDMNYTTSILEDSRHQLWIGSLRALGRLDRKARKMIFDRRSGGPGELSSTWVISMAEDRSGRLWFGTVGAGVNRLDRQSGRFKVFRHKPGDPHSLSHDTVQKIFVDHKGDIWFGTEDGLNEFDEASQSFRAYKDGRAVFDSRVHDIAEDATGTLWIATQGTGLLRFTPTTHQFTAYRHTPAPGSISSDITNSVCIDHSGTIWVGTDNGLNRLDPAAGTFETNFERDGLSGNNVSRILEDDDGKLWVSTNKGLSRFDPRNKSSENYYVSDGIAGNEFYNYASAFKSRTGEMFFSSYAGVTAFYPRDVVDNPYAPPVVITDLRVAGKSLPIGGKSPLKRSVPFIDTVKLSHTQNVVSLQFSALSYANPEGNRYRYRLDGLDTAWNESGSDQRVITYSLAPGTYLFHVQGSNSRGIWNEEGTSLQIEISPPWWSTEWFRACAVTAAVLLLGALYRYRLRQVAREFNAHLEGRVDERLRVARDLHDTLLQSFQGLLLRFQGAHNLLPGRVADARQVLETAIDEAAQAITEARDAVQDLRASAVVTNDLAKAVEALGKDLAEQQRARNGETTAFAVETEGASRELHPILRDEIYRIIGEALRNAFRHSRARRIEVEIRYDAGRLRMRVRDDGIGTGASVLQKGRAGHFGLRGMRERAKGIGGQLEVWSEQGAGTEVELTMPASVAYAGHAGRRFRLFKRKAGAQS